MKKIEYKRNGTSTNKKGKSSKGAKLEKQKVSKNRGSNKKGKRLIVTILIIVCVVVGLVLLCTLPYFRIITITTEGTSKYSSDQIIEKSGISIGKNIFVQYLKGVSNDISELSYIKSAQISVKFPNQICIKVSERTPKYIAFNEEKNNYYKIDEEGFILEESEITSKNDELLILGFIFDDDVILGSKLKDIDISKLNIFNNIKKEFISRKINGTITKVNFANSLTTVTLNDKLNIVFPNDTDVKYKMSFLKSILEKIGEDSSGVIDMTKTNPVFSNY